MLRRMDTLETSELMTIGRFARITGLTVKALRHYDEVGLLRPAAVDPETGYRSVTRAARFAARSGSACSAGSSCRSTRSRRWARPRSRR